MFDINTLFETIGKRNHLCCLSSFFFYDILTIDNDNILTVSKYELFFNLFKKIDLGQYNRGVNMEICQQQK